MFLALATPLWSSPICLVSHVTDGATLRLTGADVLHKWRLIGSGTPETVLPHCDAAKAAGDRAAAVLLGPDPQQPVTGICFHGQEVELADVVISGRDVARVMLASGLALPFVRHKHPDWGGVLGR